MTQALIEKAQAIEKKRAEIAKLWKDSNSGANLTTSTIKEFNDRNEELKTMGSEYDSMKSVVDIATRNEEFMKLSEQPQDGVSLPAGTQNDNRVGKKSLAELFVKSNAFKNKEVTSTITGVDLKTLMQTTDGYAPEIVRNRPVFLQNLPPINILDIIPTRPVTQPGVKYMQEQPMDQEAIETNEGAAYPEAAFNFVELDSPVRKIAVSVPVTDEQLRDVEYIMSYLDMRLRDQIRQRLATQVVAGTGAVVNGNQTLTGMLNIGGSQNQAKGGDPIFDALLKSYTLIRTAPGNFSNPSHAIADPVDEQNIRLMRTADGRYILGDPGMQPVNISVFGVPIVVVVQKVQGDIFVKDFSHLELFTYDDVEIQITNSHGTDFLSGVQRIRAQMRCGFHDYRPASGCDVTGL